MIFDLNYILMVMLPGLVLAGVASWYTKSTFNKYSKVGVKTGTTGAQAAAQLLRNAGIHDVGIEPVQGFLSDHYDPRAKMLRLSPAVYGGRSLSAIGVACHEAGHALQHAKGYAPLKMRSTLVPAASVTSNLAMPLLMIGLFMNAQPLLLLGAGLFSVAVLFAIVTLPVEWDASARAKELMVSTGIVDQQEAQHAGSVLNAAFLTYLASALTAILTLLYYLMRAGVLGGSRD